MRHRPPRFPADIGIRLAHGNELCSARLINVSTTGARLECSLPLPQNALVELYQLYERIPARVVWSNSRQTGVRFIQTLSQDNVNALRGSLGKSSAHWATSAHGFRELT